MTATKLLAALLLFAFLLPAPSPGFPAEKAPPRVNKVLLSLRIAKAGVEQRRISYYKSVARQMKYRRPAIPPPPSSAR